jgi:hypothetical protein
MPYDNTPDEKDGDPKTQYEDTGTHPHPEMLLTHREPQDRRPNNGGDPNSKHNK